MLSAWVRPSACGHDDDLAVVVSPLQQGHVAAKMGLAKCMPAVTLQDKRNHSKQVAKQRRGLLQVLATLLETGKL